MRIAIDTGGTFTDCVFLRGGHLEILKVPSTPARPSEAIAHALDRIRESRADLASLELVCGTTVGTNALLQRKGGRVTLVTTAGFETSSKLAGKLARNFTICCSRRASRSFRGRGASACANGWIPMAASCFRRPQRRSSESRARLSAAGRSPSPFACSFPL